ncbi:hypothetical protein ACFPOG_12900 [Paenibacillus aestuarii]|uniref:Uncharacterized protein n=1 Tax=Paenibacillus aestuarii TaxID=516965 RepID=A0ABW0K6X1_9BACL
MGKSIFISGDFMNELQGAMDNFYIAKLLFDLGKPFPADRVFFADAMHDRETTLYFEGVGLLFGSAVCYEDRSGFDDVDEQIVFSVRVPMVEEWADLTFGLESDSKVMEDQKWIMSPIKNQYCSYYEIETEAELTTFGLRIQLKGYHGTFHSFVEGLIEFSNRLQQKVVEHKSKGGVIDARNAHHFTGRNKVRNRREAV